MIIHHRMETKRKRTKKRSLFAPSTLQQVSSRGEGETPARKLRRTDSQQPCREMRGPEQQQSDQRLIGLARNHSIGNTPAGDFTLGSVIDRTRLRDRLIPNASTYDSNRGMLNRAIELFQAERHASPALDLGNVGQTSSLIHDILRARLETQNILDQIQRLQPLRQLEDATPELQIRRSIRNLLGQLPGNHERPTLSQLTARQMLHQDSRSLLSSILNLHSSLTPSRSTALTEAALYQGVQMGLQSRIASQLLFGGLDTPRMVESLNIPANGGVYREPITRYPQTGSRLISLPISLALPEDNLKLSSHQVLLREQIEAFEASEEDVSTHTRGRNKPIQLGQVGIRCKHCAHLPVSRRQKGSTYFPATTVGIYQAAQNMSTTHMQCGLCTEMPDTIKHSFSLLLSSKLPSSGAGRPYWAESAKSLDSSTRKMVASVS